MGDEARFRDFDEAFAETSAEPVVVRLFGRDWELPGRLPAAAPLKIVRYMDEGRDGSDLTPAEMVDLAVGMIPSTILDEWLARGLDIEVQLPAIVEWLLRAYMGDQAVDDASGPGDTPAPLDPPPAARSASSSNDGGSSKPTSPASTESIYQVL